MTTVNDELWSIFDARRVKQPELKGLDTVANAFVGFVRNRIPKLAALRAQAERIELLELEIHALSSARFKEEVALLRAEARLGRLDGPLLDRAMAVAREGVVRAVEKRPFPV